jgi:hypothetical protein
VRSFQISAVFPHLTVHENVRIALQRKHGHSLDFWRSERSLAQFNDRASELIEAVGLTEFTRTRAVELPYGRKRALEIATTLALDPEMMLLDEPTAGMTLEDVERIAALMKEGGGEPHRADGRHNLSVVSRFPIITVLARGGFSRRATTRRCPRIRGRAGLSWSRTCLKLRCRAPDPGQRARRCSRCAAALVVRRITHPAWRGFRRRRREVVTCSAATGRADDDAESIMGAVPRRRAR